MPRPTTKISNLPNVLAPSDRLLFVEDFGLVYCWTENSFSETKGQARFQKLTSHENLGCLGSEVGVDDTSQSLNTTKQALLNFLFLVASLSKLDERRS